MNLTKKLDKTWIIDLGANEHMTHELSSLNQFHNIDNQSIVVVNGASIPIKGKGKVDFLNSRTNALYVFNLASNLLSISKLTRDLNW